VLELKKRRDVKDVQENGIILILRVSSAHIRSGVRFSKAPKLFGSISGTIISTASRNRSLRLRHKAYQNPKRKLDVIPQPFSEIIKLKFGRKMP